MSEFDIILGMDWLSSYHVSIDCFSKTVTLRIPGQQEIVVATAQGNPLAEAFLAFIEEVELQTAVLAETRIVSEFQDVFQDIEGLPPVREIEFCIELQPGTAPISKVHYRMGPAELRELQIQLDDLSDKGLIRKSHSP